MGYFLKVATVALVLFTIQTFVAQAEDLTGSGCDECNFLNIKVAEESGVTCALTCKEDTVFYFKRCIGLVNCNTYLSTWVIPVAVLLFLIFCCGCCGGGVCVCRRR